MRWASTMIIHKEHDFSSLTSFKHYRWSSSILHHRRHATTVNFHCHHVHPSLKEIPTVVKSTHPIALSKRLRICQHCEKEGERWRGIEGGEVGWDGMTTTKEGCVERRGCQRLDSHCPSTRWQRMSNHWINPRLNTEREKEVREKGKGWMVREQKRRELVMTMVEWVDDLNESSDEEWDG